ncbi:MAG: hypothetical protein JOZ77_00130 [Candidatus Eremiobacteraeota bacterium]|nr:hypothetical protein [Candidatus Eremiobacteraeota bacterium]
MRLRYPQDCTAETANDATSVIYLTLRLMGEIDEARRASVNERLREKSGSAIWRVNQRVGRTYALLELPDRENLDAIVQASGGTLYEKPIIALALFPAVPEALPLLLEALGGAGRPAGVLACDSERGGLVVEWDPSLTGADVVMAVADAELARWQSGRTAELLAPLPPSLVATIAASSLQAPQIEERRILELRIDRG